MVTTHGYGNISSAKLLLGAWTLNASGFPPGYCIMQLDVNPEGIQEWSSAELRLEPVKMCGLSCTVERINASLPFYYGELESPEIGWDANILKFEIDLARGFVYTNPAWPELIAQPCFWPAPSPHNANMHVLEVAGIVISFITLCACFVAGHLVRRRYHRRRDVEEVLLTGPAKGAVSRPALIIANSSYRGDFDELPLALADGRAMCTLLKDVGYDVICQYNTTKATMLESLRVQLLQRLDSIAGVVVPIYFAGHGVEVANEHFIVPVDAQRNDPETYVSLTEFLALPRNAHLPDVARANSCHPLVEACFVCFLDGCRELVPSQYRDGFAKEAAKVRKQPSRRRQMAASSVAVMTACDAGDFAQESQSDGHSFFAKALLQHGANPCLNLQQLADSVREQVKHETAQMQRLQPSVRIQKPCLESCAVSLSDKYLWQDSSHRSSGSQTTLLLHESFSSSGSLS